IAAVSIVPERARSQGSGSTAEPAATSTDPRDDDDGAGSGSGAGSAAPIAPPDPAAKRRWLTDKLAAAIAARPALARAKIAVAVTDLASGDELFARGADDKLNLASNTKLLTSVAALGTLGNGFRWRTSVLADPPDAAGKIAGDLYLRGKGDPTLSAANLEAI